MKTVRPGFLIVAGLVLLGACWYWWSTRDVRGDGFSPEELKERALTAATTEEQVQAAITLSDYYADLLRGPNADAPDAERELRQAMRAEIVPHLRELVQKSSVTDVRCVALQGLSVARDYEFVPQLFELLDSPDPKLRGQAGQTLQRLLGSDYGWRADDAPARRAATAAAMRKYYESLIGPEGRGFPKD